MKKVGGKAMKATVQVLSIGSTDSSGDGYSSCRSCKRFGDIAGRGLCRRCYKNTLIRRQFGIMPQMRVSECGRPVDSKDGRPMPTTPTKYPPGSPGKILVLCARALAGVELWHPLDMINS